MVKTNAATRKKTSDDLTQPIIQAIRPIPNFPRQGILFRDITPLLANPKLLRLTIDLMAAPFIKLKPECVVGIESRGFLLASAIAYHLNCGVVPIRKKGKLPAATYAESYDLEYGQDTLEIHQDAFKKGRRVLIVDDVIATGGTALAAARLAQKAKGQVLGFSFLIELAALSGRQKLDHQKIHALIRY
ncbi:MAG: adenine phosphoribosyltransferase [Elusimicrobia bacterium]|nr:adenine phosphoribosyltransferase [Elusimicrobiota bacterium]